MAGSDSAVFFEKTQLADNATVIGGIESDEEPNTVPVGSVSDCRTLAPHESPELTMMHAAASATSLRSIGKYQIQSTLGKGGMGIVYQAFDPLIERDVAIKVLSPEISSTPAALQRFLCEARSIGRLNHPNVVAIYEINEWQGMYYLVMELLTGGSIADLSEKQGAMPWREACRIVAQAGRGLAAAHSAGMIHRDIKPANLMLSRSGDVKVVDFGLSKLLDADINAAEAVTRAGQLLGTPQYMSPEQFDGVSVDFRTDIYALGATLFRLLTNQFPYHDCSTISQLMKAHVMRPVPLATDVVSNIPSECDRIISKAMAKDPNQRYSSCAEMASDLESLILTTPAATVAPARPSKSSPTLAMTRSSLSQSRLMDHRLSAALIIEPSRLQLAMREELLKTAGVERIASVSSIAEAAKVLPDIEPDLIWSAMELPDGRGLDWLRLIGRTGTLQRTTVVLNSSDCSVADLTSIGRAGSLICAPKSGRLESIVNVIHGCGPTRFSSSILTEPLDTSSMSIRVISDTGRIPDFIVSLAKALKLADVELVTPAMAVSMKGAVPTLTMLIRTVDNSDGDDSSFATMVSIRRRELSVAIQATSGRLILRSVGRAGIIGLVRRPLDAANLQALLQAAKSEA